MHTCQRRHFRPPNLDSCLKSQYPHSSYCPPFPDFPLLYSTQDIFFLLYGYLPPLEHSIYEDRNFCLFGFLQYPLCWKQSLGHKRHTKNIYLMNEWKKSVWTVCSTSWIQRNITLFRHSVQIVPDAAAEGPPSIPSASANPICQDPSIIPPLLESFLSPFQPAGILSSPELPWYLLSFNH